jgi:hypothetical protein
MEQHIFLYIFFFGFRKINGRTKKFEKYTSTAKPHNGKFVSHGGSIPAAIPHVVKSLPPWGTTAGEHLWRQGRAAWRQDPAAQCHGGSPLPPCHVVVRPFLFF